MSALLKGVLVTMWALAAVVLATAAHATWSMNVVVSLMLWALAIRVFLSALKARDAEY